MVQNQYEIFFTLLAFAGIEFHGGKSPDIFCQFFLNNNLNNCGNSANVKENIMN